MNLKDHENKLLNENIKQRPEPKPDLIDKIAYWVIGIFILGFIIWKFAIPLLGIASVIVVGVASFLDFLFSWKTLIILILLFIAIVLNDIRNILINILRKLYD